MLKLLFVPRDIRPRRKTFKFEYLYEVETEFENDFGGMNLGSMWCSILEK
jgi:hypothetical protein